MYHVFSTYSLGMAPSQKQRPFSLFPFSGSGFPTKPSRTTGLLGGGSHPKIFPYHGWSTYPPHLLFCRNKGFVFLFSALFKGSQMENNCPVLTRPAIWGTVRGGYRLTGRQPSVETWKPPPLEVKFQRSPRVGWDTMPMDANATNSPPDLAGAGYPDLIRISLHLRFGIVHG